MKSIVAVLVLMSSVASADVYNKSSANFSNDNHECTEGVLPAVTLSCKDSGGVIFDIALPESESFCVDNGDRQPYRVGTINGVQLVYDVEGPLYDFATGLYQLSFKNNKGVFIEQNYCSVTSEG